MSENLQKKLNPKNNFLTYSNMANAIKEQQIQSLINQDKAENGEQYYHPKRIYVNGVATAKAIAFNKRMLREGKTTVVLDNTKLWNADTGRLVNKPLDKRYNDGRLKPTFAKRVNVAGDTFASKKETRAFSYTADQSASGVNLWDSQYSGTLYSNDLLRRLIGDNDLTGNYRIVIVKNGQVLEDINADITSANNYWRDNKTIYMVDSAFMIWNNDLQPGDSVSIIFTKEKKLNRKYYEQTYSSSMLGYCMLQPITDWIKACAVNAKSKSGKEKYKAKLRKMLERISPKEKISYHEKYKNGIPESHIPKLCDDLQIGMEIEQPFSHKLLFEYRSMKKPLKIFKFINTRLDHVEVAYKKMNENSIFTIGTPQIIDTRTELNAIRSELIENNEFHIYKKDYYGITGIQTLDKYYKLYKEMDEVVREWEKEQGLNYVSFDALEDPELMNFINNGSHFNGTVDFEDIEPIRQNVPADLEHIDMTKAYTQFKKCKWYNGFTMKITDFRKTNKYFDNGFYHIKSLDLTKCDPKFRKLNKMLGWFMDYNVYPLADLKALEYYGGSFEIDCGAWGMNGDWEFNNEMIEGLTTIQYDENCDPIEIPFYSKWCGMNCMLRENKSFWCDGDMRYFENIDCEANIYYADGKARISYPNSYQFNKKHITAQVISYQRLSMLEQLMKMDLNKLTRICVDGIYYRKHDYENRKLIFQNEDPLFGNKCEKMRFGNDPCETYLSHLVLDGEREYPYSHNEFKEHYKTELYDGAGGDGKTFTNLYEIVPGYSHKNREGKEVHVPEKIIRNGFIRVCYVPHSNKLESAMKADYMKRLGLKLKVSNHSRILEDKGEDDHLRYNVYLIDECSMLTEKQKYQMIEKIRGKIIFMGDLKAQLEPYSGGIQMTAKDIEHVAPPSPKNYRFTCPQQLYGCNYVRKCIDEKACVTLTDLPYERVNQQYVIDNYKPTDMILVSRGAKGNKSNTNYNNFWSEIFKDIPKYKCEVNTRDYSNGDIMYEKVKGIQQEFRHGFTVHSIQGETFTETIYIDMRHMTDIKMFYTAISRAKEAKQIKLVFPH